MSGRRRCKELTEIVIIFLLSVFLQSLQVLFGQGLFFYRHPRNLVEEIQQGVCVHFTVHHVDVILHHFDVGHRPLVQGGVRVEQIVEELVTGLK